MRVIFDGEVIVMSHFSGIGHYTLELLRAIDRQLEKDDSLDFSLLINYRHMKKARGFGFRNINLVHSPFSLRISNGLKTHNIQLPLDMFFGRGTYIFPNYSSWPLLRSKAVTFIYDISYEKYPELVEPRNQVFLSGQVRKSASRASLVATISENSKREICSLYSLRDDRVKVFYPAVDRTLYYRRPAVEIKRMKTKYDIKGDYILFVGNIEPRKNLKNLLLAYEQFPLDLQEKTSLLLIGAEGWQNSDILEIISRLQKQGKSIRMPAKSVPDKDLPALYSGAKLFVYPSIYEGFGIPPIEAMACGTPVVSANNSSLPEAVGEAALMVDAQSVSDISSKMSLLLGNIDLQKKFIKKGYQQINKFSWDDSAKKFLESMKNLR